MDLGHTIVSMMGGMPSRVICRTCKSEHNYKPKKGVKEPGAAYSTSKTTSERKSAPEKTTSIEVEWLKQINANARPVQAYAADVRFAVGDRINHPTFGEGVVQKLIHPNKLEIIFRSDLKVLIHAPILSD